MLVLNFMYMKKSLFRFSSRRILFSTVIASALIAGGSQAVFADAGEVQVVLQTGYLIYRLQNGRSSSERP